MITFQENTHFSQALPCTREEFWEQVKNQNTRWKIDARRAIIQAVEASKTEGVAAIHRWLQNSEYQKFVLKKQNLKRAAAKEAWQKKSDGERLLAFTQELKENLPAFIFACREFDETPTASGKPFRHRKLADCHLSGLFMLDIDHIENPMQVWYAMRDDKALMERIALVHITSSGCGIRIVATADSATGNLADNQIDLAARLGYKADESCIDATRNSFAPKEEDIIYINEQLLFDYYNEEFDKRFTPEYREKKTQPTRLQFNTGSDAAVSTGVQNPAVAAAPALQGAGHVSPLDGQPVEGIVNAQSSLLNAQSPMLNAQSPKWRGYDLQAIIDARYADGLPCAADTNRHSESLKLATDLMLMLDRDKTSVQRIVESQSWVQEIIAERNENVAQTVDSAAGCIAEKEKKSANPMPSKAMQDAILTATGRSYRDITQIGLAAQREIRKSDRIYTMLDGWGAEIEAMFDDFPLLRDVCDGLKRSQYPAALFVAGGALMTLMTRCTYRFYHKPEKLRRLNCSLLIIGHPASNKSMADDICDILLQPVEEADKPGKTALNRYKQDKNKKAANKEGKDKPQDMIRIHPARTSNGQLIQDMLNAKEVVDGQEMQLHMFTFDTELDNSITLQSGGSWINKQSLELKAFHNEKDGQMYQNNESPVDEFRVTWNYIYTGTPIALKKKVNERNFGSGLSTRLAVIPMPKTNFEMIKLQKVTTIDWARLERMKAWAYKLDLRAGELPVWPLVEKLYYWTDNRMADCAEDESEANELMLKRVAYHALNYAMPFVDMRHFGSLHQEGRFWEGEYEVDETDWRLCELIARIQYATQQHFFGVLADKYFDDMNNDVQITGKRHQQKSVDGYNRLPEVFTKEDVMKCFGFKGEASVFSKIKRLMDSGFVEILEESVENGHIKKRYHKIKQMVI